jgi:hypothetical protein
MFSFICSFGILILVTSCSLLYLDFVSLRHVTRCTILHLDCGTIVAPANGNVDLTDGTTYESVAVFQCNNGYDMAGAASLECLEDGSWDNAKPTCNIKGLFPSYMYWLNETKVNRRL